MAAAAAQHRVRPKQRHQRRRRQPPRPHSRQRRHHHHRRRLRRRRRAASARRIGRCKRSVNVSIVRSKDDQPAEATACARAAARAISRASASAASRARRAPRARDLLRVRRATAAAASIPAAAATRPRHRPRPRHVVSASSSSAAARARRRALRGSMHSLREATITAAAPTAIERSSGAVATAATKTGTCSRCARRCILSLSGAPVELERDADRRARRGRQHAFRRHRHREGAREHQLRSEPTPRWTATWSASAPSGRRELTAPPQTPARLRVLRALAEPPQLALQQRYRQRRQHAQAQPPRSGFGAPLASSRH